MIYYLYLLACMICIFYLVLPFLTVLSSLMAKERKVSRAEQETDFACIITAYQNVQIALPLAESLLQQTHGKYHVYLVADDCSIDDIFLSSPHLTILCPEKKLGSKIKSINHALSHF